MKISDQVEYLKFIAIAGCNVGIPQTLVGTVKEEDIPELAKSAYEDACRPGNPREVSVEQIEELYRSLMK